MSKPDLSNVRYICRCLGTSSERLAAAHAGLCEELERMNKLGRSDMAWPMARIRKAKRLLDEVLNYMQIWQEP